MVNKMKTLITIILICICSNTQASEECDTMSKAAKLGANLRDHNQPISFYDNIVKESKPLTNEAEIIAQKMVHVYVEIGYISDSSVSKEEVAEIAKRMCLDKQNKKQNETKFWWWLKWKRSV